MNVMSDLLCTATKVFLNSLHNLHLHLLQDLVTDADGKLFNPILYSKYYVLQSVLPGR